MAFDGGRPTARRTTGSRFILSHSLLAEEDYVAGLRDVLGDFRSRALFILDEAHHAAPSGGARYAISSQRTRAVRELSACFEHADIPCYRRPTSATGLFGHLLVPLPGARNIRTLSTRFIADMQTHWEKLSARRGRDAADSGLARKSCVRVRGALC
jgi:hypothetical protein